MSTDTKEEIAALEAKLAALKNPPPPKSADDAPREARRSKINALLDGEIKYLEACGAPLVTALAFTRERALAIAPGIDGNKEAIEAAARDLSSRIVAARARIAEARRLLDLAEQAVQDARS